MWEIECFKCFFFAGIGLKFIAGTSKSSALILSLFLFLIHRKTFNYFLYLSTISYFLYYVTISSTIYARTFSKVLCLFTWIHKKINKQEKKNSSRCQIVGPTQNSNKHYFRGVTFTRIFPLFVFSYVKSKMNLEFNCYHHIIFFVLSFGYDVSYLFDKTCFLLTWQCNWNIIYYNMYTWIIISVLFSLSQWYI